MIDKKYLLLIVVAVVLAGSACLFDSKPAVGVTLPPGYYSPVDSAYKVIANMQLAYETKNIDRYMECLHPDFEFHLLESDWYDYDGDGIIDHYWGIDLEEEFTSNMFSSDFAEVIELIFDGNSETVWYGDSTEVTLQLVRSFDLKVYYWSGEEQQGYRASGQAIFLCKPGDDGEYVIWCWEDQSET